MIARYFPKSLDKENIRRYIPDVAAVIVVSLLAVVIAGRPALDTPAPKAPGELPKPPQSAAPVGMKGIERPIVSDLPIKERNIFTPTGTYSESVRDSLPDNPYALIAVLRGKQRRAVFKEYTGKIITLPVGKTMIDGFVIEAIDSLSVRLKKRDEQKNLQLFNAAGNVLPPAAAKGGKPPANLFTLIGIMGGSGGRNEKKAVFRDYKGSVYILGVGGKLNDGSIITGIDTVSVRLRKGTEKNELRIFDVHNSEQSTRKKT